MRVLLSIVCDVRKGYEGREYVMCVPMLFDLRMACLLVCLRKVCLLLAMVCWVKNSHGGRECVA